MICYLCKQPIITNEQIEHHHSIYKSEGRADTAPTHKACHRQHHSDPGDFAAWGRLGGSLTALTKVWSINLKNVNTHLAFALERCFHRAHYVR